MNEHRIPTEQELDWLVQEMPRFDLSTVKRRTMESVRPRKKRQRYLLAAAVVCLLSISAMAADYASEGPITRALGIRKEALAVVEVPEAPPSPVLTEPEPPTPSPAPAPQAPPPLDEALADALEIQPEHAQALRPAVQQVEKATEAQDVRMTVLQTLGDPACLYIKLRFDFPEPVSLGNRFETLEVTLADGSGGRWQASVLEQDERSVTYLLSTEFYGEPALQGQTVTVTAENFGHPHLYTDEERLSLTGEQGKPYTAILYPDGTADWEATEAQLAALPPEAKPTIVRAEGFTISLRTDGSKVITYDGEHGDQALTLFLGSDFDAVVPGKWALTWTLSYQDLSRRWQGDAPLLDTRLSLTELRVSPLSWEARFTAREALGEELGAGLLLGTNWVAQLRNKDGSLTDLPVRYQGGLSREVSPDGTQTVSVLGMGAVFEKPMDMANAEAILFAGQEFPLT